jgi:amidophosphoribosyltransferase
MCGVFGVSGSASAAELVHMGLYSLQHRGQESAGIVAVCDGTANGLRAMGLVGEKFGPDAIIALQG